MIRLRTSFFAHCVFLLCMLSTAQDASAALSCDDIFKPNYDFLVVGAGPAGIAFATSLKRNNSTLRVLLVEKSADIGGTFSKHGRFYRLLTPFRDEASPFPERVKRHLTSDVAAAGVDLRLQTEFENFQDHWTADDANPFRYNVQLQRGGDVRAGTIVFATGTETDVLNGFTGLTREFIRLERARSDSHLFTFDEVIVRNSAVATRNRNLRAVAVVGSGIAAMNLIEFLKNKTSADIIWFVNSEAKVKERIAHLGKRYAALLKGVRARRITVKEHGFENVARAQRGYEINETAVEEIWLATGAKQPEISKFAKGDTKAVSIPVFSDEGTAMAQKVVLPGRPPQAVYIVGAASGAHLLSASLPQVTQLAARLTESEGATELSDAMKRAIIATVVSSGKLTNTPEVVLMAGLPGSGKSTIADRINDHHVVVDPDRIRDLIPMYQATFNAAPETAAARWHQAAIRLQFPIVDRSLAEGRDLLIDGTMRDTAFFKSLIERIRRDHPKYKIRLIYVPVSIDEAKRRIHLRSQQIGRYVPALDFGKLSTDISRSVQALSPLVDEFLIMKP